MQMRFCPAIMQSSWRHEDEAKIAFKPAAEGADRTVMLAFLMLMRDESGALKCLWVI